MSNVAVVPNGTEIVSPKYLDLVEKYKLFARKSAENIVKLAETLITAEDELPPKEFRRFCEDVGLDVKGQR